MSADSERRRYPTTADFDQISSDLQTRKHTMSAREAPNWPEEYGEEPRWWRSVQSAYKDNETALVLSWKSIGVEGAKALAERGLPSVPQLTQLNLYNNAIGDDGAKALAERGLPSVPQLTLLNLGGNSIGAEGAKALAERGLPSVPQLTQLDLYDNSIGDEGATALAERGLPSVPQLTELYLGGNFIGAEGAKEFARLFFEKPPPALEELDGIDLREHLDVMKLPSELPNKGNADILKYLRLVKKV
eukprot:scaffold1695_cov132-Pinguiococcus_pyrenoidosus.AAC.1